MLHTPAALAALSPAKAKAAALAMFDSAMTEPAADWRGVAFALHAVVTRPANRRKSPEPEPESGLASWDREPVTGAGRAVLVVTFADREQVRCTMTSCGSRKTAARWHVNGVVKHAVDRWQYRHGGLMSAGHDLDAIDRMNRLEPPAIVSVIGEGDAAGLAWCPDQATAVARKHVADYIARREADEARWTFYATRPYVESHGSRAFSLRDIARALPTSDDHPSFVAARLARIADAYHTFADMIPDAITESAPEPIVIGTEPPADALPIQSACNLREDSEPEVAAEPAPIDDTWSRRRASGILAHGSSHRSGRSLGCIGSYVGGRYKALQYAIERHDAPRAASMPGVRVTGWKTRAADMAAHVAIRESVGFHLVPLILGDQVWAHCRSARLYDALITFADADMIDLPEPAPEPVEALDEPAAPPPAETRRRLPAAVLALLNTTSLSTTREPAFA